MSSGTRNQICATLQSMETLKSLISKKGTWRRAVGVGVVRRYNVSGVSSI